MTIAKVADTRSSTFYVDLEACPWAQAHITAGTLRVLPDDPEPPAPELVIDRTETLVRFGGSPDHEFLIDLSRPCNWPQAERVSAGGAELVGD